MQRIDVWRGVVVTDHYLLLHDLHLVYGRDGPPGHDLEQDHAEIVDVDLVAIGGHPTGWIGNKIPPRVRNPITAASNLIRRRTARTYLLSDGYLLPPPPPPPYIDAANRWEERKKERKRAAPLRM